MFLCLETANTFFFCSFLGMAGENHNTASGAFPNYNNGADFSATIHPQMTQGLESTQGAYLRADVDTVNGANITLQPQSLPLLPTQQQLQQQQQMTAGGNGSSGISGMFDPSSAAMQGQNQEHGQGQGQVQGQLQQPQLTPLLPLSAGPSTAVPNNMLRPHPMGGVGGSTLGSYPLPGPPGVYLYILLLALF